MGGGGLGGSRTHVRRKTFKTSFTSLVYFSKYPKISGSYFAIRTSNRGKFTFMGSTPNETRFPTLLISGSRRLIA